MTTSSPPSKMTLDGKIAVGYGIERVLADLFEAQQRGGGFAADGEGGAGQCGCAQRHTVGAAAAVGHAFVVATEHFHIGQQVVNRVPLPGSCRQSDSRCR